MENGGVMFNRSITDSRYGAETNRPSHHVGYDEQKIPETPKDPFG
jgi:hypothetical protein